MCTVASSIYCTLDAVQAVLDFGGSSFSVVNQQRTNSQGEHPKGGNDDDANGFMMERFEAARSAAEESSIYIYIYIYILAWTCRLTAT